MAELTAQLYFRTEPGARRSWARTGTSINSARVLDGLASTIARKALDQDSDEDLSDPEVVVAFFAQHDVWKALLALPERPRDWDFAQSDNWRAAKVAVDEGQVLIQWLSGARYRR